MKKILIVAPLAAMTLLAGCGSVASPSSSGTTAGTTLTGPPSTANITPPVTAATAPASPPQYTASQQQAITAAENYLTDGQGFSQAGLISQLTSSYGNGFSTADATFAVDTVYHPGLWDQQADASAANYMSDGEGFSCSSLLQQLTSQYGSQFTYAQAEHGVQSVGLGTC